MTTTKVQFSIVITTFDRRFESHFIPLLQDIFNQNKSTPIEIIAMINGPHRSEFNQDFRRKILTFISEYDNVFPTMFPNFQSLSKLWNRGILTAQNDLVLVLNDDLRLKPLFFETLEKELASHSHTFRINDSFSHYVMSKTELLEVGFFDERLLGIGEEDGDFAWRYHQRFGIEVPSINIPFVDNIQSDIADPGFKKGTRTYSKFNRDFVLGTKYKRSLFGHKSMFDYKVTPKTADLPQYPYESFYREHIKDL